MSKGLSSVKTLTAKEIAKKWNLPLTVVAKKIAAGVKVEKEHTKSTRQANEIARDHLGERPDYYDKLHKMEKQPVVKEQTSVGGVRGLGYVSGDPSGTNYVEKYVNTNSMSYNDQNGNNLKYLEKAHKKLHHKLGFKEFDPTKIKSHSNKDLAESLGSDYGTAAVPVTGDLTGNSRKISKVDEVKLPTVPKKLKKFGTKAAATGLTLANIATLGQVAGDAAEQRGSPKRGIVAAATGLPGKVGWGATAGHYTIKGMDYLKGQNQVKEDLRKWFREKWVRYDTKGNIKGPCAREEGEGKPKCRPLASARAMSKEERAKSARRKRREDPVADRSGKGGKPIMVRTEETLLEKNVPTNPALWARAKAQARAKFDVYPSAYANGWASKWYKSKGGGWKSSTNESIEEACWSTHRQKGMKKKGGKMVPNCVPVEEQGSPANPSYTERPTYEGKNVAPMPGTERGIYEVKASTIGRAVAKASAQRKELTSKKMGQKEIEQWWKKERLIRKGTEKLTGKSKVPASLDEYANVPTNEYTKPYMTKSLLRTTRTSHEHISKPDTIEEPGRGGHVSPRNHIKEETKMDTKELINEALDNIIEDNLVDMKENFLAALQEKAMEKLEERKKIIASEYFAQ